MGRGMVPAFGRLLRIDTQFWTFKTWETPWWTPKTGATTTTVVSGKLATGIT